MRRSNACSCVFARVPHGFHPVGLQSYSQTSRWMLGVFNGSEVDGQTLSENGEFFAHKFR